MELLSSVCSVASSVWIHRLTLTSLTVVSCTVTAKPHINTRTSIPFFCLGTACLQDLILNHPDYLLSFCWCRGRPFVFAIPLACFISFILNSAVCCAHSRRPDCTRPPRSQHISNTLRWLGSHFLPRLQPPTVHLTHWSSGLVPPLSCSHLSPLIGWALSCVPKT